MLIEALYTDSQFYSKVGQQFSIVFDIFYSKTGTEAVAESFDRVVEKQEMNGGQSISVLGNRAKIDWCFPPIVRCERALDEMAKLYVNGLKKHNVPVYTDKKSVRNSRDVCKVISPIKSGNTGWDFIL